MATKIVTKNSSTASAVPTASDLVQGELAVNVADKRLFTEDNTGTIVELGTNPSTIDINAGSIDGTAIGASSASTGAFTTLTATGLTVDTNTLYVDSTNNRVGIGTTSPSSELTIGADTPQIDFLKTSSADVLANVRAETDAGSGGKLVFQTKRNGNTALDRMIIDDDGRVGIGTTSPISELHVADATGNTSITMEASDTGSNFLLFGDVTDSNADTNGGRIVYSHATEHMQFNTNATERMRIDSSGNVGIGTTSPSGRLHLSGDSDTTSKLTAQRTGSTTGTAVLGYNYVGSFSNNAFKFFANSSERMRIDSSGRLLMGKTSATATGFGTELRGSQIIIGKTSSGTVNGIYFNHNSSYVGGLNYTNTATALATSSDQRLKENIADADDAGSKIDAIQVRKFDWKEDNSHQEYGFIAQELEQVFPYAVHTAQNEMQTKGVDYASLVPMMLKEIQSLRNRVAQLEE